jgi:hypothetical protein
MVSGSCFMFYGSGSRVDGSGFQSELVLKARRHLYHSTLGLRVINKKKDQGLGRRVYRVHALSHSDQVFGV